MSANVPQIHSRLVAAQIASKSFAADERALFLLLYRITNDRYFNECILYLVEEDPSQLGYVSTTPPNHMTYLGENATDFCTFFQTAINHRLYTLTHACPLLS